MWRSKWRYGLAAFNFQHEEVPTCKCQHGKSALPPWGARAPAHCPEVCRELQGIGPCRMGCSTILHQSREGHSQSNHSACRKWVWWAVCSLGADSGSGHPQLCCAPAATARRSSCRRLGRGVGTRANPRSGYMGKSPSLQPEPRVPRALRLVRAHTHTC